MDKNNIGSLLGHIEGHVGFAREALESGDAPRLRQQAVEIEGWASAIKEAASAASETTTSEADTPLSEAIADELTAV